MSAAGLVQSRIARETGKRVSIYDGEAAGLDTSGGRWQTVCEEHGWIVAHEYRKLAELHAPNPLGWCDVCRVERGWVEPWEGIETSYSAQHPMPQAVRERWLRLYPWRREPLPIAAEYDGPYTLCSECGGRIVVAPSAWVQDGIARRPLCRNCDPLRPTGEQNAVSVLPPGNVLPLTALENRVAQERNRKRYPGMADYPCLVCGAPCAQGKGHKSFWLHGGGSQIVTAREGRLRERDGSERSLDMGLYPIGKDCYRDRRALLSRFVMGEW